MCQVKFLSAVAVASALTACQPPQPPFEKLETVALTCEAFDSVVVNETVLYNNVWNAQAANDYPYRQCLEQKPGEPPYQYGWSWDWPNKGRQIFAYPQIKVGSSPWDPLPRVDDRFPVRVGNLDTMRVSHRLEIATNGEHNVATSLWLTDEPFLGDTVDRSVIAAEIMIWTYYTPKHMNPAGEKRETIVVDGHPWSVWVDQDWRDMSGQNDNRWLYLTFRSEAPSLSADFDVAALLTHESVSALAIDALYIADLELGTEIMRGSGLVWVEQFSVDVKTRVASAIP